MWFSWLKEMNIEMCGVELAAGTTGQKRLD
jgi:hypothetical protein